MAKKIKYLNEEKAKLYRDSDSKKVLTELLWGDRVELVSDTKYNGLYKVNARGAKNAFIDPNVLGDDPLLEFYFIDVGQGDGVLIVTPERKHILIDGGYKRSKQPHGKSAADFVDWKFKKDYNQESIELDAMICSHCDADHYGGLWDLLNKTEKKELDTIHTNVKSFYHAGVSWWKDATHSRFLGEKKNVALYDILSDKTSIRTDLKHHQNLKFRVIGQNF